MDYVYIKGLKYENLYDYSENLTHYATAEILYIIKLLNITISYY